MSITRRNLLTSTAALGAAAVLASLDRTTAAQGALKLQLYTADDNGFLVNSVILTGEKEAILVDAQFTLAHAHRVAADVLNAGKRLTQVYISHAHPDHYFGIEVIKAAFPDARIVAAAQTVADIEATGAEKIAQWGPKLGANGPSKVTLPVPFAGNALELEGHRIEIIGPVQGDMPHNTALWIPSLKAVIAGDIVYGGTHVWTASADRAERAEWVKTLARLEALDPAVVVPGHVQPGTPLTLAAVRHTRAYLELFDQAAAASRRSDEIIKAVKAVYPNLPLEVVLELGAKVAAGDMKKWI